MIETPHKPSGNKALLLTGVATALVYGLLLLFLNQGYLINTDLAPADTPVSSSMLWFGLGMLVVLYLKGYWLIKARPDVSMTWILGFTVLLSLLAMGIRSFNSTDMMSYIKEGWTQAHYGLNVYVHPANHIPNWQHEPMFHNADWFHVRSPYGFLFAHLTKFLAVLGQGHYTLTVMLFKGVNVLAHLGTAILVGLGARRLGLANPALAVYTYAWSPLVLLHNISNGHNDVLMAFLSVLAFYCLISNRWAWSLPALVASALVKHAAAVSLVPVFYFLLRRASRKTIVLGSALAVLVAVVLSAPYLQDASQIPAGNIAATVTNSRNSLFTALFWVLYDFRQALQPLGLEKPFVLGVTMLGAVVKLALWFVYAVAVVGCLNQCRRLKEIPLSTLLEKTVFLQFVLIFFVSTKFWPWYISMFFPLALWLEDSHWLRQVTVLLSLSQLFGLALVGEAQYTPHNALIMTLLPLLIYGLWRKSRPSATVTAPAPHLEQPLEAVNA